MYILGFVSDGLGNKLYMLTYYIYLYFKIKKFQKIDKIYLVSVTSGHEKDNENEKIYNIFPLLKKQDWLEWIDWEKYKILKKGIKQKITNTKIDKFGKIKLPLLYKGYIFSKNNFFKSYKFFSKLYTFNDNFHKLDKNYNFNGVAVHIRLGDKISYIYDHVILNKRDNYTFTIFTPEYYIDHLKNFSLQTPVYIFTDSPKIFEKFYSKFIKHNYKLVNLNFYESFYLMSKFKNIILSDSTLGIFSSYFNVKDKKIYGYKYIYFAEKYKEARYVKQKLLPETSINHRSKKYYINENIKLLKEIYEFNSF